MTALPRLHVVTNDVILANAEFLSKATALMSSPIALHLRGCLPGSQLQRLARSLRSAGSKDPVVTINDRVDVAVATGLRHVHLPETGLPLERVRAEFGKDLIVGVSVHSAAAATRALDAGADYVFLGPIWHTKSHPDRPPLGLQSLSTQDKGKVIAIGGITEERIQECLEAGAYGVAVISAVWDASDPVSVVRRMCDICHAASY